MQARGVKPELEAYNEAMLEEAEYLIGAGLLEPPYLINCVLHAHPGWAARVATQPHGHGRAHAARKHYQRQLDGAHAAADHDNGAGDRAERARWHGRQRVLSPWRIGRA